MPPEQVLIRHVYRGRVWGVLPVLAIEETPEHMAFWLPEGTLVGRPQSPRRRRPVPVRWKVVLRPWEGSGVLILAPRTKAHAVWHFWHPDDRFSCWYVNLEEPLRPTKLGFDTMDQALDLIAYPDRSWEWKDEHELAEQVELGCFSPEEGLAIRAEGERVLDEWPFPTGWEDWRPDPAWPIPRLPDGWEDV